MSPMISETSPINKPVSTTMTLVPHEYLLEKRMVFASGSRSMGGGGGTARSRFFLTWRCFMYQKKGITITWRNGPTAAIRPLNSTSSLCSLDAGDDGGAGGEGVPKMPPPPLPPPAASGKSSLILSWTNLWIMGTTKYAQRTIAR